MHDLDVKTIISRGINHPDHFVRFSKSLRNRFSEAEQQITINDDMIVIAPWSQIMNNNLKEYYKGMSTNSLPAFQGGKTILLLEGNKPFEDNYLMFPSNFICEDIRQFAESGYKKISAMSYFTPFRRTGFVVTRSSSKGGWGMSFTVT